MKLFNLIKTKKNNFIIDNKKGAVLCLLLTLFISGGLWITGNKKSIVVDGRLSRPAHNENSKNIDMEIYIDGEEEPIKKSIELEPQKYTDKEIYNIFELIERELPGYILNNNKSLDEIKGDLILPEKYQQYPITMEWYSENYELIDTEGKVYNQHFKEEQNEAVNINVVLSYDEKTKEITYPLRVIAPNYTPQQKRDGVIDDAINDAKALSDTDKAVKLPETISDRNVKYYVITEEKPAAVILILGLCASIILVYRDKDNKNKLIKAQNEQLCNDYSELITKFTLLIGSGMTIRKAWEQIVYDAYSENRKDRKGEHEVYKQMYITLNEMRKGVSEERAYEEFALRCKAKEYIKFSALLQQNLKKGTKDLILLLQQETYMAFEERKNKAKIKGEQAGTKLLFPMILLLIIVMVVIIVPAFQSFVL